MTAVGVAQRGTAATFHLTGPRLALLQVGGALGSELSQLQLQTKESKIPSSDHHRRWILPAHPDMRLFECDILWFSAHRTAQTVLFMPSG